MLAMAKNAIDQLNRTCGRSGPNCTGLGGSVANPFAILCAAPGCAPIPCCECLLPVSLVHPCGLVAGPAPLGGFFAAGTTVFQVKQACLANPACSGFEERATFGLRLVTNYTIDDDIKPSTNNVTGQCFQVPRGCRT
eukprot:gb/GEZN01008502.1/.p1 GENE.gb/GEZN01008502.1/~~gb/GEZN01008502.1/.p1  ORF type:complete len:137 (-),score=5.93 gb/GEZN01008502.1/:692-1102(-)